MTHEDTDDLARYEAGDLFRSSHAEDKLAQRARRPSRTPGEASLTQADLRSVRSRWYPDPF